MTRKQNKLKTAYEAGLARYEKAVARGTKLFEEGSDMINLKCGRSGNDGPLLSSAKIGGIPNGIVRGRTAHMSIEDVGDARARELAEANLRSAAFDAGCTNVSNVRFRIVRQVDRLYGKRIESFYYAEGDGYSLAGGR
jgi:hypothetical protein